MRERPRTGKRHVLRWVAVAAVVIVAAGTLTAYLKYRAVYDSITRISVPGQALGHRPPVNLCGRHREDGASAKLEFAQPMSVHAAASSFSSTSTFDQTI